MEWKQTINFILFYFLYEKLRRYPPAQGHAQEAD